MIIPTYAKIIAALVAAFALVGVGWYGGRLQGVASVATLKASQAGAENSASQTELKKDTAYDAKLNKAQADYLNPIPIAPVTRAVWVCNTPPAVHSSALPSQPHAASPDPGGGGVQPRDGAAGDAVDIRPAIEAFKARWEQVIAQCRLLRDSWPP